MPAVLAIEAEASGERRRHAGGRLRIGRGADNDWRLMDSSPQPTLSRHHCVIEAGNGGFTVVDLGSTNGTRLNGRVVPPHLPTPLSAGDRLELGAHVLHLTIDEGEGRPMAPLDPIFEPPSVSRPAGNAAGPRSLDTLLGGLGVERPVQPAPVSVALTADDDPLGGLFDEAPRPLSRTPPAPPPRDMGPTAGDHSPPQLEVFELPQARQPMPPPPPPPQVNRDADLLKAFLEGAGLDPKTLPDAGPEMMQAAGSAFAAMAAGLRDLLATRALIKDHAGVARTVIGAMDNNPLKYSVGKAEAVRSLLTRREAGYLEPLTAVEASLDDLKAHELALLEGVQAAVNALLAQFDPARLEERLGESSALGILLQGGRRAKLWDLYTEKFSDIAEAARVRFMGDVDRAFAAAYDRKVRELRARRRTEVAP
ncbi:MAG: type VI secretion system-associated FHA domain protein TagH [Geminicoccaceae bacterium]